MPVCYAPDPIPTGCEDLESLFLAGSIEMGTAENWQEKVCQMCKNSYLIYNPRRPDWDSSLDENSEKLANQIRWEQEKLEISDNVLFYFDPNTKSPITLLELGQCLERGSQAITVVCPDGFWRKTNIIITCNLYGIPVYNSLDEIWV